MIKARFKIIEEGKYLQVEHPFVVESNFPHDLFTDANNMLERFKENKHLQSLSEVNSIRLEMESNVN